ncbi:hypothetical protein V8F20_008804 [Naviculisporaceae sp. PSN 640]
MHSEYPEMARTDSMIANSTTPAKKTPSYTDIAKEEPLETSRSSELGRRLYSFEARLRRSLAGGPPTLATFTTWGWNFKILAQSRSSCALCKFFHGFSGGFCIVGSGTAYLRFCLVPLISSTKVFFGPSRSEKFDTKGNVDSSLKFLAMGVCQPRSVSKRTFSSELFRSGLFIPRIKEGSATTQTWPRPSIPFLHVSNVNPLAVSYTSVFDWLSTCEDQHGACCHPRSSDIPRLSIKCIDCYCPTLRVVAVDDQVDYLALSYVWGCSQLVQDDGIPTVVQDSITVTKRLGKRYLWVDKYCVEQENHDLRAQEIQAMDRI